MMVNAVVVGMVDEEDVVDTVNMVEMLNPETAMKVTAPVSLVLAFLHM
jgi:hypothetical protein